MKTIILVFLSFSFLCLSAFSETVSSKVVDTVHDAIIGGNKSFTQPINGSVTGSSSTSGSATQAGTSVTSGSATVSGSSILSGSAAQAGTSVTSGSATVSGSSILSGSAAQAGTSITSGSATVSGSSILSGSAAQAGTSITSGSASVSGSSILSGSAAQAGASITSGSASVSGSSILSGSSAQAGTSITSGSAATSGTANTALNVSGANVSGPVQESWTAHLGYNTNYNVAVVDNSNYIRSDNTGNAANAAYADSAATATSASQTSSDFASFFFFNYSLNGSNNDFLFSDGIGSGLTGTTSMTVPWLKVSGAPIFITSSGTAASISGTITSAQVTGLLTTSTSTSPGLTLLASGSSLNLSGTSTISTGTFSGSVLSGVSITAPYQTSGINNVMTQTLSDSRAGIQLQSSTNATTSGTIGSGINLVSESSTNNLTQWLPLASTVVTGVQKIVFYQSGSSGTCGTITVTCQGSDNFIGGATTYTILPVVGATVTFWANASGVWTPIYGAQASGWSDSGGNWTDITKWFNGAIPNAKTATAYFGSAYALSSTITVTGTQTIGRLSISGTGAPPLFTGGALNLDNNGAAATLNLARSGTTVMSSMLSGSSRISISESNNSVLLISGSNKYTGGTALSGTSIQYDNISPSGTPFGTGAIFFNGINNTGTTYLTCTGTAGTQWNNQLVLNSDLVVSATSSSASFNTTGSVDLGGATRTIVLGPTQNCSLAGSVSNGALVISRSGNGFFLFSSSNSFTSLLLTSGTVLMNNSATLGSGTVTINAGTVLSDNRGGKILAVPVTGSGGVIINTSGTNTWSGANSYTGNTTVSGGWIMSGLLGSGSYAGNIVGSGAATMTLSPSGPQILSGTISGASSVVLSSSNYMLTFNGANTYTGGTILNGTNFAYGNTSGQPFGTGTTTVNGLSGSGTTTLAYTAATTGIIFSGKYIFNSDFIMTGSTSPSFQGVLDLGGGNPRSLIFQGPGSQTLSGSIINGNLTISKASGASLSITGTGNTYGTMTCLGGNITFTNTATTGTGAISNSTTISDARTGSSLMAVPISGTGSFNHNGTGNTLLSSSCTYTGTTTVSAGTLTLTGTLANSATKVTNGLLCGTGTGGGLVTVSNLPAALLMGGTNTANPGTLTFNNGITFAGTNAGLQISASGSALGLVVSTGTATLNNASVDFPVATTTGTIPILSAALISGTMHIRTNSSGRTAGLIYTSTNVQATLN